MIKIVKHPKYQARDDARQSEIPQAFKKFSSHDYNLQKIDAVIPDEPVLGPIPRPHFEVQDNNGNKVAIFYPNGHSECLDEKFRATYEKMGKTIEDAANKALQEYLNFEQGNVGPKKFEPGFPV